MGADVKVSLPPSPLLVARSNNLSYGASKTSLSSRWLCHKQRASVLYAVGAAWSELGFKRSSSTCNEATLTEVKNEAGVLPISSQERICEIKKCINKQPVYDPRMRHVCTFARSHVWLGFLKMRICKGWKSSKGQISCTRKKSSEVEPWFTSESTSWSRARKIQIKLSRQSEKLNLSKFRDLIQLGEWGI